MNDYQKDFLKEKFSNMELSEIKDLSIFVSD